MHRSSTGKRGMADCNLDIPADKLCKYAYMSWCPTCDRDSSRRRTKSETYDSCRKKPREMKTYTPKKYDRRCEYENDLELDVPDVRYDRVRSNLCELPTTYISNNCQFNLPHGKLLTTPDYLDGKIQREYSNGYVLSRDYSPPTERLIKRPPVTPQKRTGQTQVEALSPHGSPGRYNTVLSPQNRNYFSTQRVPETHTPKHETCTFFDMNFDTNLVRERYSRELDVLREKLRDLHNKKYAGLVPPTKIKNLDRSSRRHTTNVNLEDIRVIEDVPEPKIDGMDKYRSVPATSTDLRRPIRSREQKQSSSKISIKASKSRYNTGRTPKLKLRTFKLNSVLMEDASTTESELEELLYPNKKRTPKPATSGCTIPGVNTSDLPTWPLRKSLFPHIPPYLMFCMHDAAANKLPPGKRFLKWKLSTITPIVVRKTLLNTGFRLVRKSNDWMGTWGKHMKSPMFKTLKNAQKLNHFAGTFQLGRKDRLWRNVQRLMHRFGAKEFGFIPQTFILPNDIKSLKKCWECKDGSAGEKWIIKPPASARGVGIKVINKWSQLPKQTSIVVQKYIADPYLINGSKFDLRLYVLVTSFNPLRIYLYPEGLVRFASVKYSDNDKDLKDRFMHLTNYSINKLSSQYTANEDANACQGHKWTLTKLWEYLRERRVDTKFLWESLKELVIKTMLSGESPITQMCSENVGNRYNCYELFGVDVLFDERLKPWLLEVNISPSLHSSSPLDLHVKGPLVQTLFNLAQFHLPPKVTRCAEVTPPCYDPRIYTTTLTPQEANKHNYFVQMDRRDEYINEILDELTGDDVRFLTQAEDEREVEGSFERIFPTADTYTFLDFIPVRYYNRLFDAWENRYQFCRDEGIDRLKALCSKRIHLKVQPPPVTEKSFPSMIHGVAPTLTSTPEKPPLIVTPATLVEMPNAQKTESVTSAHDETN
ncbi:tubulin monoglutamylase TTLL4-like isoform X2 [Atheta coriaria]|uniref:tubulin monoglutamylase TTLL4-like isoform X2 n=1 Tax=Dalotia coriaria TaxID=877792 RepID=UPI0031F3A12B